MSTTKQTGASNGSSGESGTEQGKTDDPMALELRVEGVSKRESSELIGDFQAFLQSRTEDLKLERRREDPASQDAGTLLVALLTPAMVELGKTAFRDLAKGIADWIARKRVTVVVDGVTLQGSPEDVERILRRLLKERRKH